MIVFVEYISIHAPANGATAFDEKRKAEKQFQSTLRRTERRGRPLSYPGVSQFQSTLRRTERPTVTARAAITANFNPRSGERSDGLYSLLFQMQPQFQSTLRRTERPRCEIIIAKVSKFQSTLRRTERLDILFFSHYIISYFNPRSGERSD